MIKRMVHVYVDLMLCHLVLLHTSCKDGFALRVLKKNYEIFQTTFQEQVYAKCMVSCSTFCRMQALIISIDAHEPFVKYSSRILKLI